MCENVSLTTINTSIKNDIWLVLVRQAHVLTCLGTDITSKPFECVCVCVVVIYLLFNNTT